MGDLKKQEIIKVHSLKSSDVPSYGWYKVGEDLYLNLGVMNKAVVIRRMLTPTMDKKFFISTGSYFPFPSSIYDERFPDMLEAQKVANDYIGTWLRQTYSELI